MYIKLNKILYSSGEISQFNMQMKFHASIRREGGTKSIEFMLEIGTNMLASGPRPFFFHYLCTF